MYAASRMQIYLADEQRIRIDKVCVSEGTSLAQVVRDAVDAHLSSRPNAKTVLQSRQKRIKNIKDDFAKKNFVEGQDYRMSEDGLSACSVCKH
jgi:hypothetical protein